MKRVLLGVLAAALSASVAAAALMPDEVSKRVAQQLGVKVLRVVAGELDGKQVFTVTVIAPAGNSNDALRVDHVTVDAETGQLVRAFRHLSAGYALAGEPPPDANRNSASVPSDGKVWR